MERIQITDGAVVSELCRQLRRQLDGDPNKEPGLYYVIAHGVANWDSYLLLAGQIRALEAVLKQIEIIANSQGAGLEEKVVFSRSGLN